MTKDFKKRLCRNLALLVMCPISVGVFANSKKIAKAASFRLPIRSSSGGSTSSLSRVRPLTTTGVSSNLTSKHKLTAYEKTLAGVTIGFSTAGLVGTAVGIALTDSQYKQAEKSFNESINNAYDSFYKEREQYMKTLYSQWGMTMPEKYKNPLGSTNTNNGNSNVNAIPDRGFSIG